MSVNLGLSRKKSKESASSTTRPFITNTGFSSLNGTSLTLDPSIRSIEDAALTNTRGLIPGVREGLNTFLGNQDTLRNRFLGNSAAFTQARVNPLAGQLATRRGELQRSVGLRGLGGSSFGEQSLTNFDIDAQRGLGDARALAEMENLRAVAGIDQATWTAVLQGTASEAQVNEVMARIAEARSQRELAQFGLGTASQGKATGTTTGVNFGFTNNQTPGFTPGGTP